MKNCIKYAGFVLVTMLLTAQFASAGWFESAIEGTKERMGRKAINEAADGAYDAGKDAAFGKDKKPKQETTKSRGRSSYSDAESSRPAPGMKGDAIDDDHFIQKDDFFISDNELGNYRYIYVQLAKMVTEPSERTKNQGEFFTIPDGRNKWTKYYYKTRIAKEDEIRLGKVFISFEGNHHEVYGKPDSKEGARSHRWFMAKITDTSDMYRGFVTVSGNYKIALDNLRVIVPYTVAKEN